MYTTPQNRKSTRLEEIYQPQIAVDYFHRSSELFGGDEKMVRESRAVSLKELRECYVEFRSPVEKTDGRIREVSRA